MLNFRKNKAVSGPFFLIDPFALSVPFVLTLLAFDRQGRFVWKLHLTGQICMEIAFSILYFQLKEVLQFFKNNFCFPENLL